MIIIKSLTDYPLYLRTQQIKCIVIHGTGCTSLQQCLELYHKGPECPHYVIADDGKIYQTAEINRVAYHAAMYANEARTYRLGFKYWSCCTWIDSQKQPFPKSTIPLPNYMYWRSMWQGKQSPLDLVTDDKPNSVSVGVELLSLVKPTPAVFNDNQYESLAQLCESLLTPLKLEAERGPSRHTLLAHADINPLRRCTGRGPYDVPSNFDWPRLINRIRVLAQQSEGVA